MAAPASGTRSYTHHADKEVSNEENTYGGFPGTIDVEGEPENERLPLSRTIMYGLQHVLTMYGGIIAPPLIVGSAIGATPDQIGMLIACCLFIGGLATILQTVGFRSSGRNFRWCRASRSHPSRR